jgi:transcriptional regulator with XRE-family HTH domain
MNHSPIKVIRLRKGISQSELSKITGYTQGYTQGYISFIEKGRRIPSYENLSVFAEALNCKVDDLTDGRSEILILEDLTKELCGLSPIELEKILDYVQVLKRGRR